MENSNSPSLINLVTENDKMHNKWSGKRQFHNQKSFTEKRQKFEVTARLKEVDVGITEYLNDHEGFVGTIKERYSDFHVHEIASDGQLAKLTNQELPPELNELEDLEKLRNILPDNVINEIDLFSAADSPATNIEIDVTNWDKNKRRAIHVIVKNIPNTISQTVTKEDKKVITVIKGKSKTDRRVDWSKRGGDYCHFLLHKINLDTMDALNRLSSSLRMKAGSFTYAGTKDRRGKTTQWVSIKKVDPKDILRAARSIKGLFVGNFKFDFSPLKLGMLFGNRFTIVLRNIIDEHDKIEKAMVALKNDGFINYYGLQRFGTVAHIPTHHIGRALLKGNWNEAIDLILKPRDGEQDKSLALARKIYKETGNAKLAYDKLNRTDKIEAKLFWALHLHGNSDPQGVLNALPRNVVLMYLHAYQSLIWNYVVSRRLKEYGKKPIVGDLVYDCIDNKEIDKAETDTFEEDLNDDSDASCNLQKVKILTQEDLVNYNLKDIIMPQPGWKVTYPPYALSWYEEFLGNDGLTKDLKQKNKKYTLGGSYRKILQVPDDVSWEIVQYNEKNIDLFASDIDQLRELQIEKHVDGGQYKALIVKMTLPSSTYATMALREMLKHDTSSQSQAELTAIHGKNKEEN